MGIFLLPLFGLSLFGLWLWYANRSFTSVPPEALAMSPHRWTVSEIHERATEITKQPLNTLPHLPPVTGRRYVVVGGSGFVGGWIVLHLLLRGEDPKNIRILDIRRPTRRDMLSGKAVDVGFVAVDIRDLNSVRYAFKESWPEGAATGKGVTVIHTAANLRFYERHEAFIRRSAMVNVEGTRNLLTASRETGADIFIFTSSASIKIQPIHFWKLPFRRSTGNFVQTLNDSSPTPGRHEECWSNYGYTKILAENLVREADDPGKGFRTGCLQPGSVIFGPGGDFITSGFLKKGISTYWVKNMIQSFVYVENVSYAHLLYEARLLEALGSPAEAPVQKLGGDTFMIAGAGNPVSHGDILLAMASLTDGSSRPPLIPTPPAVVLHLISYLIEFYHMVQFCLSGLLPPLTGDIIKVQPSMFHSSLVHFKTDDSRARLPSSEGGLGYSPPWTTLDGIWQAVYEHLKDQAEDKAIAAGKL